MPNNPTWEETSETLEAPTWEETTSESQAPSLDRELERESLRRQMREARAEAYGNKAIQGLADLGERAAYTAAQLLPDVTGIAGNILSRQGYAPLPSAIPEADLSTISQFAQEGLRNLGLPEEVTRPSGELVAENVGALAQPKMAAQLMLGVKDPATMARVFQGQMGASIPESIQQTIEAPDLESAIKSTGQTALSTFLPGAIELGLRPKLTPIPDIPGRALKMPEGARPIPKPEVIEPKPTVEEPLPKPSEPIPAAKEEPKPAEPAPVEPAVPVAETAKVAEIEAAENQFPQSKFRDESGNLRVAYHGTRSKIPFSEFNEDLIQKNEAHQLGAGYYFETSEGAAQSYAREGGHVVRAYLDVKNPAPRKLVEEWTTRIRDIQYEPGITREEWQSKVREMAARMRKDLIEKGYDSYMPVGDRYTFPNPESRGEIVVLSKDQIKILPTSEQSTLESIPTRGKTESKPTPPPPSPEVQAKSAAAPTEAKTEVKAKQPKITFADLSKTEIGTPEKPLSVEAIGAYNPLTGQTFLDKSKVSKLSPEERASVVRHELAHKIETETELWQQSDDFLWRLWEADRNHPIWDLMGEVTGKWKFGNDLSPEIVAELYANHYPKGTFTVKERPVVYEWEGEDWKGPKEYPIPPELMSVLDQIESKLGIWKKKQQRGTAQTQPPPQPSAGIEVKKQGAEGKQIRDLYGTRTEAVKRIVQDINAGYSFVEGMTPSTALAEMEKSKKVWTSEIERLRRVAEEKEQPNEKDIQDLQYREGKSGKQMPIWDWANDYGIPYAETSLKTAELTESAINRLLKINERRTKKKAAEEEPEPPTPGPGAQTVGETQPPQIEGTQGALATPRMVPTAPAPTPPTVPIKAVSQIIRDLSKGLNVPIRFGRLTTTKYAGYFKKIPNLIGSKRANDLPVVSHEIGHKLDSLYNISSDPALRSELDALGDPARLGPGSSWTSTKGTGYKMGEGVAEFIRQWIDDPTHTASVAPNMHRYFESLLNSNQDMGRVLRQAQENVRLWKTAPPLERLDSSIVRGEGPVKARYTISNLTRDLVDDLHFLKLATEEAKKTAAVPASKDPYVLARLLRGTFGMADTFIRKGVVDFKTKAVNMGTGLEDILKPVSGRINDFRRFIIAKRAKELMDRGKNTGLQPGDVAEALRVYQNAPEFQRTFDRLKEWNDSLLQYAFDAGMLKPETLQAMRQLNQDYVPFHRFFEIGANELNAEQGAGTGRGLNVGTPGSLRRLKGSNRDIVDPLETMVRNAYAIITASEKNALNVALADLADKPNMGKWVEHIRTPIDPHKVTMADIRRKLEAMGADVSMIPDDAEFTFFRRAGRTPYGENIIKVVRNGNAEYYRVNGDLYETFHALDYDMASKFIRLASLPARSVLGV